MCLLAGLKRAEEEAARGGIQVYDSCTTIKVQRSDTIDTYLSVMAKALHSMQVLEVVQPVVRRDGTEGFMVQYKAQSRPLGYRPKAKGGSIHVLLHSGTNKAELSITVDGINAGRVPIVLALFHAMEAVHSGDVVFFFIFLTLYALFSRKGRVPYTTAIRAPQINIINSNIQCGR